MPRARRRSHHEEGHDNGERWLLTYSDMITLLMVLFIVLFAMGQTDLRKFNAFKESFKSVHSTQPNPLPGGVGIMSQISPISIPVMPSNHDRTPTTSAGSNSKQSTQNLSQAEQALAAEQAQQKAITQEAQKLYKAELQMKLALQKAGLLDEVTFSMDQRGLVVTILTDKILFPLDSAVLQPEGTKIINTIAPVLAALPNQIDVEGNTDNQAITGGPYPTNWDLSAARAVAVVRDLIDGHGIAPKRLQATGNADTRPIVPNDNPVHQSENRRVELVVFSTTVTTP